ncbi:MAG: glycosyltransferase family protein [Alphaproteobacteria bacterium]|nr:glycosyltransferase family protein [Alphaproteobacteria bacterium]
MSPPRTVAVIQARMTSRRLPGKVLLEVLGRPLLGHQIDRVGRATRVDAVVIATTANPTDDPIAALAKTLGIGCHRGSETDVLGRVTDAAEQVGATVMVRLTGDCPLIDPDLLDAALGCLIESDPPLDYVTNDPPRTWPIGLDVEVMRMTALRAAAAEATDPYDREHVTPFLYTRPERFRLDSIRCPEDLSHHRWTLDEPADFELIKRILEALLPVKPDFGWRDVLALVEAHPEWRALNRDVQQTARPGID